jgi:RND family efflux transporter MFP subunit
MRIYALLLVAFAMTAAHAADKNDDPKPAAAKPLDFTGHLEATSAQLRPRVSGFLTKTLAREGTMVKAGDLIAEIDSRPYQAILDQAISQIKLAEAQLKLAETVYARDKAAAGVVSMLQVDQDIAEIDMAKAKTMAAKAVRDVAELNVSFTRIKAPFDGKLGRLLATEGNLLVQDTDTIITIVRTDPLYVAFDVDEGSILKLRESMKDKKLAAAIGFADEDGFPHAVTIDFVDCQIDPKTGTIRFRATLPNPKDTYLPGMFVRVRLTPGK